MGGREELRPKTLFFFVGNVTTILISKVQLLLSRNFVVIAQAPIFVPRGTAEWLARVHCVR